MNLYVFGEPHHMTFYMNMNYPQKKVKLSDILRDLLTLTHSHGGNFLFCILFRIAWRLQQILISMPCLA